MTRNRIVPYVKLESEEMDLNQFILCRFDKFYSCVYLKYSFI